MAEVDKIDSNSTGLRFCEEDSSKKIGTLPPAAEQVWRALEPNSYSDFGGQIKTVARKPINASRQNKKGVTVDLDASGGYNSDVTKTNMLRLLQGFFFADIREPFDSQSYNGENGVVTAVATSDDTFHLALANDFTKVIANHLLLAEDFAITGNNGVHVVSSKTAVAATGVLTSSNNYADGDTVTIGDVDYAFESGTLDAAYKVKLGATEADSITNLAKAVNANGVAGTDYAVGTEANPDVTAVAASHTLTVTAREKGYSANSVALDVGGTNTGNGAWGGATLTGGQGDIGVTTNLVNETPSANARVQVVGYQFASGTVNVDVSNALPRLVRASGTVDYRDIGLVPGQFVFVGGDATATHFVSENNAAWARVRSVAAAYIEFDKTHFDWEAEVGTGLTIRIFFGKVLKNEADPALIKRRSFTFERDLGRKDTAVAGHQSEVLKGAVANQYTLNTKEADKLNADLTFVAKDHQTRTQAQGLLSAQPGVSAPDLVEEDAFNTTSHVARLRMTVLSNSDANPTPLFGYVTDFTTVINNNITPNKAVSVLGAFDLTAGQFDVTGKVTAYFSDVAAVAAVRNNSDVSLDYIFVRDGYGMAYDVPLVSLGDGRLSVEQDQPITLPLDVNAGADRVFNHTLLVEYFPYLPDAATPTE